MDDMEIPSTEVLFPPFSENKIVTVKTSHGDITVYAQECLGKPSLITYHDLGLNGLCFQSYFKHVDIRILMENFSIYHINAPGQETGAPNFSQEYTFPSMDELAEQINNVMSHFGINTFIGIGVGAGANILARFALANPIKVGALCLIDCSAGKAGWIDWMHQKLNMYSMRNNKMNDSTVDYLMWYHFGRDYEQRNQQVQLYRRYFGHDVNANNLSKFIASYNNRTNLRMNRKSVTLRMPVLNVTGALSVHADDTVDFNGRLLPTISTWMKISDCAMVLEEQPAKIAEALRLFLLGHNFVAPLSPTKIEAIRRISGAMTRRCCRKSSVIRITENPIAEAVVC